MPYELLAVFGVIAGLAAVIWVVKRNKNDDENSGTPRNPFPREDDQIEP